MGKLKRQKNNKKAISVYTNTFQFRQPYQVLVDANFIHVAIQTDKKLHEILPLYLQGECRIMTTYCCYAELKKLGPEFRSSAALAKKLEKRRCTHSPAVSASECLKEIMGTENKFRYCVATQDVTLRQHFRSIPGIPLIYINKSVTILEPPSRVTLEYAEKKEIEKVLPKQFEKSLKGKKVEKVVVRKKKKKEPNPLSVKKKKDKGKKKPLATSVTPTVTSTAEAKPIDS